MNKLDYSAYGGNGIESEDFEWLQNATKDALKELLKGFGINNSDSFIIYGCDIISGAYTDGAIVLNGEILPVQAAALPALNPGETYQFQLQQSFDPAGLEPLESGGTTNQYVIRTAIVVSGIPGTSLALAGKRLFDEDNWIVLPLINGAAASSLYGGAVPPLSVRRTKRNTLEFRGWCSVPEATLSAVLPFATLPPGYIPDKFIRTIASLRDISATPGNFDKSTIIQINNIASGTFFKNGEIRASNTVSLAVTPGQDVVLYFDGISIPLD
jgi:hypothetical protein